MWSACLEFCHEKSIVRKEAVSGIASEPSESRCSAGDIMGSAPAVKIETRSSRKGAAVGARTRAFLVVLAADPFCQANDRAEPSSDNSNVADLDAALFF